MKYNPILCLEDVGPGNRIKYYGRKLARLPSILVEGYGSHREGQGGLASFSSCEDDWHLTM